MLGNKLLAVILLCVFVLALHNTNGVAAAPINRYLVDNNGYYSTLEHKPHDHVILTSSGAFVFFMDYDNDNLYYRHVTLDGTVGARVQVSTYPVYDFGVASDGENVVVGYSYSGGVVAYRTGTISGGSITFAAEVQPAIDGFSPAIFSSVTCDSGGKWVSWIVYNNSDQQQYFLVSKKLGTSYVWMHNVPNHVISNVITHRVSRDMIAYVDSDGVYVAQWNGNEFGEGTKAYEVTPTSSLLVSVQSFQRSPNTSDALLMILLFNYDFYPSYDCTEYVLKHWTGSQWLTYPVADGGAREMKQAFWIGKPAYSSVGRNTPLELTWYWKDSSWQSESSSYASRMVSSAANSQYKVSALYDYDNDDIYLVVFEQSPPPPSSVALTVSVSGEGSTTPPPGTHIYQTGSSVPLSAAPGRFAKWVINGTAEYTSPTLQITLYGNTTALAVFNSPPSIPEEIIEDKPGEERQSLEQPIYYGVGQAINALPEPLRAPVAFTLMGLPIIFLLLVLTGGGATVKGARRQRTHRRGRR